MARGERKDLGYLGEDFQYKLVHTFMEDKEFFKELNNIVDQNMFTDSTLKMYVGLMKEYYEREEAVPSYTMMGIALNEKAHNPIEQEIYNETLKKIEGTSSEGVEYIRTLAGKFFKQQNIVKTANSILKIAGDGDTSKYEECVELLNQALNQGTKENFGNSVFDDIGETLSDDYRTAIPTGIGKVDEALEGGLGKGELGVIIGSSSFGKAQPLDSRILTPNGYKLMGEMSVGDYVIGRDGKSYKVSGVFPQGLRPIYKVSFSNGTSCECDIEHLWNVNSYYQRCGKKYIKGLSKNRDDKYYVTDNSFKTLSLKEIIKKGITKNGASRFNFKVPKNEVIEFNDNNDIINPYLVGYIIGDGNLDRVSITVGEEDKINIENELKAILKEDLHIFYRKKRNIWSFDIVGESKQYIKDNFIYQKSDEKIIPNEYIFNSSKNRIALLQGLMDSDGSANKNGSCEFCSKSEELAKQVQFLVRSLGGFASLTVNKSGYFSKKYNKYVDCGLRYRVTITMCDENIKIFRLKRKQERVKYRTRLKDSIFITNAEYVGEKEAQCIMVDSDEHLYLTEDFIVTHNTSMTTAMASHAATYKCPQNNFKGYKVLQIVFEDRIKQIQRKHLGRITGIEAKDLSKPGIIDQVREQLEKYEDKDMLMNNLKIVRFPSGELTATHLQRYIKKLINNGFKPDLTIIDYFECLSHLGDGHNSNEYEKEGKTMRKLESMAGELDMALWIPTQGTKDSVNLELVTMDKAGGSFKKIQIAHIVMSIARTMEDIEANRATIALLKNRAGKSGKVFNNVEFNNGTCRISTDHVDEFDNMIDYNKNSQKERDDLAKDLFKQIREKNKK